jgi:type VI secretion system secreted protein Hcp
MAADMFLKIDDIKGESLDATHTDAIEVLSWSWSLSQNGTAHSGTGAGGGKVSVRDLSVTKYADRSSAKLMQMCCNGKHFQTAQLTVRKAGGNKPVEYLKIKLNDGLVSSMCFGGGYGEERLTETIALNFASFTQEYTPQSKDGGGAGTIPASWNIAKNAEK